MKRLFIMLLSFSLFLIACNKDENETSADSNNIGATINGVLVTEDDALLSLSLVTIYQNDEVVQQILSDTAGKFIFKNIATGAYKIGATNEKYKNSELLDYEVQANTDYDLTFVFHPIISISGLLLDINKYPIKNKLVYLKPNGEKKSATITEETITDNLGKFYFYSIEPGIYDLYYNTSSGEKVNQLIRLDENKIAKVVLNNTDPVNYDIFTDARDGHVYKTVTIGNQVWMAENLAYLPQVDNASDMSSGSSRYYVNGYTPSGANEQEEIANAKATGYYKDYGVMYNVRAVMNGDAFSYTNPSGVQGIGPAGWHIPSDAEWDELRTFVQNESGMGAGTVLKASALWRIGGDVEKDSYGFGAVPGGWVYGNYNDVGDYGYYYSASGAFWELYYYYDYLYQYGSGTYWAYGMSVRCVKD